MRLWRQRLIKWLSQPKPLKKKVGIQDKILNSKFTEELRHDWKASGMKWRTVKHLASRAGWDETPEKPSDTSANLNWWSAKNPKNWWNNKAKLKQKKRPGKNDYMKWTWDHKPEAIMGMPAEHGNGAARGCKVKSVRSSPICWDFTSDNI